MVLFCIFTLFSNTVSAFEIPSHNGFVTDNAELFTDAEERKLESEILQIRNETTAEIAVLTVYSTYDVDIYDFTLETFREWGIGKKDKNNGVFIVIAKNDRKWRIMTGYGVEGTLPDSLVKKIGENCFPENFKNEEYFKGIELAIKDMGKLLKKDPSIISFYEEFKGSSDSSTGSMLEHTMWISFCFVFLFRVINILLISHHKKSKLKNKEAFVLRHKSAVAGVSAFIIGAGAFSLDFFQFEKGIYASIFTGVIYFLMNFGFAVASYMGGGGTGSSGSSSSGGSSGSSSSGGFGGGSSGGGGAGGSW